MIYPTDNGGLMVEGTPPHEMVVFIKCHTGSVGSSSSDILLVDTHDNVSQIAHEMANENAQSHGLDGEYECTACDSVTEGEVCEDCGGSAEWVENEGIEGYAQKFQLSKHCARIGGFDWGMIFDLLQQAGVLNKTTVKKHGLDVHTYHVQKARLFGETGLFNDAGDPQGEWDYLVSNSSWSGYNVVDWVVDS